MATLELAADNTRPAVQTSRTPKAYSRTKLLLGLASSALSFAFLTVVAFTGIARFAAAWAGSVAGSGYPAFMLFAASLGFAAGLLTLPVGFLSGYVVEHRYGLSNQTLARWAWEHLKGMLVGLPIAALVLTGFYFALHTFGGDWWLPLAAALTLFSAVLARLAPVLILPLFYTLSPLPEGTLRERIASLCRRAGVEVGGIYSFDMSRNTRKANAAFTGIGRAKRILLGDTLLGAFTEEEIETVFAHELGHRHHRHIMVGMLAGALSTFAGLWAAAGLHRLSLGALGYTGVTDTASLPLLALWLSLLGLVTAPLGNMLSRFHERQADAYAVAQTRNAAAFASALRKLAASNLADPSPHPAVEFLFHSHPSIARRIRAVEAMAG
jgi:STE24 endopeptidase